MRTKLLIRNVAAIATLFAASSTFAGNLDLTEDVSSLSSGVFNYDLSGSVSGTPGFTSISLDFDALDQFSAGDITSLSVSAGYKYTLTTTQITLSPVAGGDLPPGNFELSFDDIFGSVPGVFEVGIATGSQQFTGALVPGGGAGIAITPDVSLTAPLLCGSMLGLGVLRRRFGR